MPIPINSFNRVQQWATFARQWWLYDAYGQDPFLAANMLRHYLVGRHKPIYNGGADVGDHVVAINSKFVAMPGDLWERIEYFHNTGYAGGKSWTPAWKIHQEDPTDILRRTMRKKIKNNKLRGRHVSRFHIFPTAEVPEEIMKNISGQIRQISPIHKKLSDYTPEERDNFPRIFQYPADFVLEPNTWFQPKHRLLKLEAEKAALEAAGGNTVPG